jgi:hypothetical protein
MAAEAMSVINSASLVSGASGSAFYITSAARRCIDPTAAWSVLASGVTQSYSSVSVDFLFGEVAFATAPASPTGVTFNGNYLPLTTSSEVLSEVRSFTLNRSDNLADATVFSTTATYRRREALLRDVEASLDMFLNQDELATLRTYMNAGTEVVLEVYWGAEPRFRARTLIDNIEMSGNVDGLLEASVSFKLSTYRVAENNNIFVGYSEKNLI